MENTKKNNGKGWSLWYSLHDDDYKYNPVVVKIVKFRTNTHNEMLKKALKILKRSAKRVKRPKSYYVVSIFPAPLPGKETADGREIFRLKNKYSARQAILKIEEKDLQNCFVQGWRSEALEQLFED